MQINGKTAVYLVLGNPIAQVRSPGVYTDWCRERGINAVFVPFQPAVEAGGEVLKALSHVPNLAGLIVTIPFKPLAAGHCRTLTQRARAAGAVNVMRANGDGTWHGDALDGVGCVAALRGHDVAIRGSHVHVTGSGGAGASVAAALAEAGAARLSVEDLVPERAAALAGRLRQTFPGPDVRTGRDGVETASIIVNASPSGMQATDPLPLAPEVFAPGKVFVEMIMQPACTPMMEHARARGSLVLPGAEVLEGQKHETLRFFGLS
ncbi:shikimate dehydrogenase family protein [Paenirhodobacter populi]|uniref:Shikimate dehydrogenase substrate binding N-terminal domain-containing protein n=1 Tax=Paenirhodobacter populi TaxID=2306993 RepID=A0A443JEN4_9RHOB|nr:hypothetical protein [Sinirhodobacter populi]RWR19046.1 hypothetical protein D2T30_14965 [Sinirhodobacter populi]